MGKNLPRFSGTPFKREQTNSNLFNSTFISYCYFTEQGEAMTVTQETGKNKTKQKEMDKVATK